MKTCINCGKPSLTFLCEECEEAGSYLEDLLKDGIRVEYTDGTVEICKQLPL